MIGLVRRFINRSTIANGLVLNVLDLSLWSVRLSFVGVR